METPQRVALVSGSNRGIGREIARQLAELGHHVIVTARDRAAAEGVAEELSGGGRHSLQAEQLDVADPDSVERLRERLQAEPARLDALVNNAGVMGETATNVSSAPLDDAHRHNGDEPVRGLAARPGAAAAPAPAASTAGSSTCRAAPASSPT